MVFKLKLKLIFNCNCRVFCVFLIQKITESGYCDVRLLFSILPNEFTCNG